MNCKDLLEFKKVIKHTSIATLTLIENSIIQIEANNNIDIDVDELKELKEANRELSDNGKYCVLMIPGEFTVYSKEALIQSASETFIRDRLVVAIVEKSLAVKIGISLYLKIFKPNSVIKLFSDNSSALCWLREIRDEQIRDEDYLVPAI